MQKDYKILVYFHYFYLHELKEPPPPPAGEEPNPVDPVFDDPNPVDPKVEPLVPPEKEKKIINNMIVFQFHITNNLWE